jgi:hypothetical protein
LGEACGFCGTAMGPFTRVEGLFEVLMCPRCQRDRGHRPGPYPAMTPEQQRASLELLPTWVLEQKVTAQPRPGRGDAPASRRWAPGGADVPARRAGLAATPSRHRPGDHRHPPGTPARSRRAAALISEPPSRWPSAGVAANRGPGRRVSWQQAPHRHSLRSEPTSRSFDYEADAPRRSKRNWKETTCSRGALRRSSRVLMAAVGPSG